MKGTAAKLAQLALSWQKRHPAQAQTPQGKYSAKNARPQRPATKMTAMQYMKYRLHVLLFCV